MEFLRCHNVKKQATMDEQRFRFLKNYLSQKQSLTKVSNNSK